jgi:hypothetical protein
VVPSGAIRGPTLTEASVTSEAGTVGRGREGGKTVKELEAVWEKVKGKEARLVKGNEIGKGYFGNVYAGHISGEVTTIALKQPRAESSKEDPTSAIALKQVRKTPGSRINWNRLCTADL